MLTIVELSFTVKLFASDAKLINQDLASETHPITQQSD